MQQEIRISKRLLGLLGLLAAAVGLAVVLSLPGMAQSKAPEAAQPKVSAVGVAAEAGVAATFNANYRQKEAWLKGVCDVSSVATCKFYTDIVSAGIWPKLEAEKAIVTAQATAVEKVDELQSQDVPQRVLQNWKVSVSLSKPWPPRGDGLTEFVVYAQVVQEGDGWKFAGILLPGQTKKYETSKK